MKYEEMNDNELLSLARENNEEALELIIKKYKHIILTTLKDLCSKYNIYGLEMSDLYQEGLIGISSAIDSFDETKNILFFTYVSVCIRTSIVSSIKSTFRNKHKALNTSYSLDGITGDQINNLHDIISDEGSDPNKILIDKEEEKEFINNVSDLFSESEKSVFGLKLKGLSNIEISKLLNIDKKNVENALSRIRKKCKEYMNK